MKNRVNIFLISLLFLITIVGFLLAVLSIKNRQQVGEKAAVSGGTATISFLPAGGNYSVGSVLPIAVWFNTKGTFISAISLRAFYPYSGTTPELSTSNIQINSSLLTTGDWSCPVKTIAPVSGTVQIDIACINVSTTGFSSSEEILLGQFNLSVDRNPNVNPITLSFDPVQTKITRKNDAQDILGTTGTAIFQIGSVLTPTPTLTLSLTPTPTLTLTPTPILVCDPQCFYGLSQCLNRVTPKDGSYSCRINRTSGFCPQCNSATDEWCWAYCKNAVPTLIPTATPTLTLSLTLTPTTTVPPAVCPLKSKGDADCNNKIILADFFIWRREFLAGTHVQADFNANGVVDINDFFAWRNGFLGR